MTGAILGLTAGFVFVVVLLLSLNLRTSFHWGIKAAVVLLALVFYVITLHSLPGFYGWPTMQPLPKKFLLLGMDVREPRNETDSGVIYMWVVSLEDNKNKPRAYQLSYSQELHSRLTAAKKRMEFGHNMAGELEAETSDKSKRGGLPRLYFIEKQRPPPKSSQ
jgi:hypothetical protein